MELNQMNDKEISSRADTEPNTGVQDDGPETADISEDRIPYGDQFGEMSDEDIVQLCHEGNADAEEYLLNKYKNFVRSKARSYFLIGADHEDIVQEGMIGLYKSIRDYKQEKLSSFRAFAELCITRQIITAIKTATRQKHIPLNSYVSLNKPLYDEESDRTLLDIIMEGSAGNPEDMREISIKKSTKCFPGWNRKFCPHTWTAKVIRKLPNPSEDMLSLSIMLYRELNENWKSTWKKTAVSERPFSYLFILLNSLKNAGQDQHWLFGSIR